MYFPPKGGTGGRSATIKYMGETAAEIFEAADSAIVGEVVEISESAEDDKSYSQVRIHRVLKGSRQAGETVAISETGLRRDDLNDTSFDGVPLLRTGMRVVLFLMPPTTLKNGETGCGIRGLYLGKYLIDPEDRVVYSGTLGGDDAMMLKDCTEPLPLEEFLSRLPLGNESSMA